MSNAEARRAEILIELEWLDAQTAFLDAKAKRDVDPEGYAKAKERMSGLRVALRTAGEASGTRTPVGGIAVTSTPKEEG